MEMSKEDGGPAFAGGVWPEGYVHDGRDLTGEPINTGMSLRDYFAAKAMAAVIACPETPKWIYNKLSLESYRVADAMLKEREK
jgi:hypothetical protein